MATEYKLSYTGAEINEKLGRIPNKTIATEEQINKFGGTVEITSGEPAKENTVLTLDPNGNEVNIYTAEEVDFMMSQMSGGVNMPTKTSDLENDSGFISSIPSEYVTETELNAKGYLTSVPSEYVTETELSAKGYLTSHQDISGKADKATTLAGYGITDGATKTELSSLSEEIVDHNHDDKYQPKGNYLTSLPSHNHDDRYFTETEANAKFQPKGNYLTEHQDISGKLDKNQGAENVGMFVAVGSDGKLTLVEPPEGGLSGDVVGNLDESNNILLQGDIANGTYTLNWLRADGTIAAGAGSLIVSAIQTFAITKTLSNCTASGATEIRSGGSATVTITANSGYTLPDSIIVSGASYTWNKSNGQIILSNPTSDVAITVTAEKTITNFAEYNATNTSDWSTWINNARAGSDGTYRSDTFSEGNGTPVVSNYIEVQNGDIVEFEGFYVTPKSSIVYNSSKTILQSSALTNLTSYLSNVSIDGANYKGQFTINNSNVKYIRLGGYIALDKFDISIKIKRNGVYL